MLKVHEVQVHFTRAYIYSMEKFAIDLDRVLDEFELNEDLGIEPVEGQGFTLNRFDAVNSHYIGGQSNGSSHLANYRGPPYANSKPSENLEPHVSVENSIDLSDADFAPAQSTTSLQPLVSRSCHQAKLAEKSLNVEEVVESSSASCQTQAVESLVPVPPLVQLADSDSDVEHRTISEPNSETKKSELQVPCHRMAAPSKSRKFENGTGVVDGIKVLHCDETINKEYLVSFGRRWDPDVSVVSSNSYDTVAKIDDIKTPCGERVIANNLSDEIQDEGISMDEADGEAPSYLESIPVSALCGEDGSSALRDRGRETGEETFVTPDDNLLTATPVTATRIGFLEDIEITDEDLHHYLQSQNVNNENLIDCRNRLQAAKEEFYTPMIEDPVSFTAIEEVSTSCESTLPSSKESAKNTSEEFHTNGDGNVLVTDGVANENNLLVQFDTTPGSTESSHDLDLDTKASVIKTPKGNLEIADEVVSRLPCDASGELHLENPQNGQNGPDAQPQLQVTDVDQPDLSESGGHLRSDAGAHDSTALPPAYQDAWGQQFEDSEVNAGVAIDDSTLPSDLVEDSNDPSQRLSRPTSLDLPGKIEVVPPADIPEDMGEGHRPFGSLMATAGSPDAGLGVSPGSSDDMETPAGDQSPKPVLSDAEKSVGKIAPVWVPDSEAPNCMQCDVKFTVIKRRHHCRACGKVLCGQCCGLKAKLHYMDNKEARVCQCCLEIMQKVQLLEQEGTGGNDSTGSAAVWGTVLQPPSRPPNPNNPSEYCSVIPPLQQCLANANAPPPTVMVPVGVLKRGGGRPKGEPKQVMFSDGIRPGGDLTELDGPEPKLPYRRQGRLQKKVERPSGQTLQTSDSCNVAAEQREYSIDDHLDMEHIMSVIKDESSEPVVFVALKNLRVLVKIINLDCCVHKTCWCFVTRGMGSVGQDEMVILLELLLDEKSVPYDIFYHFIDIYNDASKGITIPGMGHSVFNKSCLGSREHGGFLFIHPTFQCLQKLPIPPSPFLFGLLLQKWEIPWAKVFPLRLLLRFGAEFRYYPTSLVGVRFRKPVFCEIGHTIVNLLADFRNYQYSLPSVPGLTIHMEDKQTYINFPRNRYDEVVKALNSSIDHVLALASSFSTDADSHLVCIQNEDGNYQTQAINIKDKPRKITGASFVVFNGALKSSSGLTAKSSIVEDGLMVQIPGESMLALRQALRDMRDYEIPCGPIGAEQPDEMVHIVWVKEDQNVNVGVKSPIDGMAMDGVSSIRIHCGTDYVGDEHLIRWTEVYLVRTDDSVGSRRTDPVDISKVSDSLAQACCVALAPHLGHLYTAGLTKIGLRVTLDPDNVGYEIGAGGERLPSAYMNDLDSELVPAMHCAVSPNQESSVLLELIFHIIQQ